jgi:hypothetical protein
MNSQRYSAHVFFAMFIPVFLFSLHASAEVYELTSEDDWFAVLQGDHLQPGDEVVLAEGTYTDQRRLVISHRGTEEEPIVIRGAEQTEADQSRPVLQRPDARQNTINIEGAQYLVIRDIEITGGSTGIRMMKSDEHICKFIAIEDMEIHHVGGPAITANSPGNAYEGLVFRRNEIHHTSGHGEGFYLGSNNNPDGSTAGYIFNCLIEDNYIHDLNGPDISQGDGIEIKDGSYNNIVKNNRIRNTNYPGILVYGTDGKAPNIIENNIIVNSEDHGIQAAGEAVIRNNIVYESRGPGIGGHPHQSAKIGDLRIVHNTIVLGESEGSGIRYSAPTSSDLFGQVVIANNAIYVQSDSLAIKIPEPKTAGTHFTIRGNMGTGRSEGIPSGGDHAAWNPSGILGRDFTSNFVPHEEGILIGSANPDFMTPQDMKGLPREEPSEVGAQESIEEESLR